MLSGFDDDLAGQITATSNRIRRLLTQIHPALERVLGPRLDHPAVLDLLETWPTPAALTAAGKTKVRTRLLKKAPRLGGRLTDEIFAALAAQTVVVTGTNAAGIVLPRLAAQLAALRQQRAEVAEQVEELVAAHPLSKVLTTMPGVGVRTCARILTEVVGKDFPTAGHLASYAGLAPVTRRSGTSSRGEHPPRNKVLNRALFLSAFAALSDPVSRANYDRKTSAAEEAQRGTHRPRPPPHRHPVRHAPRQQAQRSTTRRCCLTKVIGVPPAAEVGLVLHRLDRRADAPALHGDDQRPPGLRSDDPVDHQAVPALECADRCVGLGAENAIHSEPGAAGVELSCFTVSGSVALSVMPAGWPWCSSGCGW